MEKISYKQWMANHSSHEAPSIINQILPEDAGEYILISGKTGIGKSVLSLHLAFCLATGTPFYSYATEKVVVNYIGMEGGRGNWRDRFTKVAGQYPDTDNLYFQLSQPMDLLKEKVRDELKKGCEGCRVVILDNLRQVTSGQYLDPNYAAEWIKTYQKFLTDIGAVGILTHHIRKKDARYLVQPDDVYQLKGATEYVDVATSVLLLERTKQGKSEQGHFQTANPDRLTLYFAKTRIATDILNPIRLARNYERCSLEVEAEEQPELGGE